MAAKAGFDAVKLQTYEADKIEAVKKGAKRSILSKPTKIKKKSYS